MTKSELLSLPVHGSSKHRHSELATPEEIIDDARNGRMFVLVDDESRENEGDVIIPAQMATPDAINFMVRHARGLVCLALTEERIRHLGLRLMSEQNGTKHQTAFTVSIEAREGVTTGISAADRARTIQVAIDPAKGPDDIVTPGHIFPLVAREGGVLLRAGHTEASVDVARLAGLNPAGVICEVMNDDGTMARLPELLEFSRRHGLRIGSIADLISYRRRHDTLIHCANEMFFKSRYGGDWRVRIYVNKVEGSEHLALVKGDISPAKRTLVRMHVVSILDDVLGRIGDRSNQLHAAMDAIGREGSGVVVIIHKAGSTTLTELLHGIPEPTAYREHGNGIRDYGNGAQILVDLGVQDMILLSNSQRHSLVGLEGYGLRVVEERLIPPLPDSNDGLI